MSNVDQRHQILVDCISLSGSSQSCRCVAASNAKDVCNDSGTPEKEFGIRPFLSNHSLLEQPKRRDHVVRRQIKPQRHFVAGGAVALWQHR